MWRIYQSRRSLAVLVAPVLSAGMLVQGANAQTSAAKCDPTEPNTLSCTQTTSKTTVDSSGTPKTVTQQVAVTTPYGNTSWQGLNWGIGIWTGSESPVRRSTTPTLCVLLIHPAMLVSASCWRRIIFLKNGFLNQSAGTSIATNMQSVLLLPSK